MSDLISRQAVLDELEKWDWQDLYLPIHFKQILDDVPSVENKGEWIVREDNTSFVKQIPRRWVECSHCGWSFSYDRIHDNFCSKCGADMRGEAE